MFERAKSFFLQGKIQYQRTLNEQRQVEIDNKLIDQYEHIVEAWNSGNLDAWKDKDESNWTDIAGKASPKDMTQSDNKTMRDQAFIFYHKNAYGRNIIRLYEKYIAGKGLQVIPDCDLDAVDDLWKKFWKLSKMNRRCKEMVRRFFRDGDLLMRKFPMKNEDGLLTYRFLNPEYLKNPEGKEVNASTTGGIETDPDDIETVISYWYKGEQIPAEEIIHEKAFADSDEKRGHTLYQPVGEELAMHKDWSRDRMKLNKIRSMLGLVRKVNASPTQAENIAKAYQTARQLAPDGTSYHKTPEGVAIITANKGVEYEFKTPNLQAADVAEDGHNILRTVCAGTGLAEYMVTSDASNSNYASTMVAEAPSVREFQDWQDFFKDTFETIYYQVISYAIEKGVIPEYTTEDEPVCDDQGEAVIDPVTGKPQVTKKKIPTPRTCKIVFPEIVHRDLKQETDALTIQKNEGALSMRTYSARLDLDYEQEQQFIEQEAEEEEPDEKDEYSADREEKINAMGEEEGMDDTQQPNQ